MRTGAGGRYRNPFFGATLGLLLAGCAPLVNRVERPAQAAMDSPRSRAQQFLAGIARQRPRAPVRGLLYGEPVMADYAESGSCLNVLVTYQNLDHSETWIACPAGTAIRSQQESRKLPSAADFKAVRHAAIMTAWRKGEASADYAGYEIRARLIGPAVKAGCEVVESAVALDGLTLEAASESVCGGE
ncbi:MAG: hypothetical protein FIA97_13615 [Methylococcaceae bacterium]|nr:hypothetical protein [Methylococcaceae bacterium]